MDNKLDYDSSINFILSIGYSGADREDSFIIKDITGLNKEGWDNLSIEEQEDFLQNFTEDWAHNYIEYSWYDAKEK